MQTVVLELRQRGLRVGVVPTMGALHEGHLSLVRASRECCERTIVTIFVNPTQFGPSEDFQKYPRTLESDLDAIRGCGADFAFVPTRDEMYPDGFSTYVEPPAVGALWEGECRPGHFRGVVTVVLKLFQVVPAHAALFGQKDFQQCRVIQDMVRDLNVPVEICVCPTVRESDGLAMSSRNRYLDARDRQRALSLYRSLCAAKDAVAGGQRDARQVVEAMHRTLRDGRVDRIDYAALVEPDTLRPAGQISRDVVAIVAAFVGTTRLIDNAAIHVPA